MARVYYHAPDDSSSQLFTLPPLVPLHIPLTHTYKSLWEDIWKYSGGGGGSWEGVRRLCVEVLHCFGVCKSTRWAKAECWVTVEALEVGQDVTLLSPSSVQAKERQREHFPEERRAERLDHSRCFPGAYRGRGPSGFVSCGCSCLRAKWTTVDLTLDLSSPSLPPSCPFISSSFSALTVCLSPSFLSPSHTCCLPHAFLSWSPKRTVWVRWPKVFPQFHTEWLLVLGYSEKELN